MACITINLDVNAILGEICHDITVDEFPDLPGAFSVRYTPPELAARAPKDQLGLVAENSAKIDDCKMAIAMTVAVIRQEGVNEYLRLTASEPSTTA